MGKVESGWGGGASWPLVWVWTVNLVDGFCVGPEMAEGVDVYGR